MLSEKGIWRALTTAAESRQARKCGRIPGSIAWIDELIAELHCEQQALAYSRQSDGTDVLKSSDETDLLTSREVSEIVSVPLRTVQRHPERFGGVRNGHSLVFLASAVREHLEGMCA